MSPGGIESAEAGYREFNSGDLEALVARLAPEFEWTEAAEIPGPKSCENREQFVHFMRSFDRLWDEFRFEPLELSGDGVNVVLAKVRAHARGRASEEPIEFEIYHVWSLRNGLFVRMDAYLDGDEAREAAGLAT